MQMTAPGAPQLQKNTLQTQQTQEHGGMTFLTPSHFPYNTDTIRSLFSNMPDFPKVFNKPFTKTESNMQYWFKSRSNLQTTEIQSLLYDVCYVRHTSKHGNTYKLDKASVILSLCGFCSYIDRDVFLRMLRHAFQPRLMYASEVSENQWEAIMVMNSRKYSPQLTFHGRDQFVDYIQKFCDLFKLSICVLELPSWTDPATVTAIQRIQNGFRVYGNWENTGNNELRLEFQLAQEYKSQALMNQNVMSITDMEFTTGNMLHLFHELRNAQMETARLSRTNFRLSATVNSSLRSMQDVIRRLSQQDMQMHHLNVSTYALLQVQNNYQTWNPAGENNSNENSNQLHQFHHLLQSLRQRHELITNALTNIARYMNTSLSRSDMQTSLSRIGSNPNANQFQARHSEANNRAPNNAAEANEDQAATTPVYNQGNQGPYVSPPQLPYPASPPPRAQTPPQAPQIHRTGNLEVIDLTNDDTMLQTTTPHTTIQILRRTPRQQTQRNQVSFSRRTHTASLSDVPQAITAVSSAVLPSVSPAVLPGTLPPGPVPPPSPPPVSGAFFNVHGMELPGLTEEGTMAGARLVREGTLTGARARSALLHFGSSLDDHEIDVD